MEALKQTTLFTWGIGKQGQLGYTEKQSKKVNLEKDKHYHLPVGLEKINNADKISLFSNYSMYGDTNGNIFSFGSNLKGRLGQGIADEEISIPRQIAGMKNIMKIDAGNWHALCIDSAGVAFSTGNNSHGELGRDGDNNSFKQVKTEGAVKDVYAGFSVSFFIDENNMMSSCGKGILSGHAK